MPSPTAVPDVYPPPPEASEVFEEPRFRFDLPVAPGSTTISGEAPPGLSLAIADVTFNGAVLGIGSSDGNGRFTINVQPLPEGHRIGITFAELEQGKTYAEMSEEYYPHRGDGFMNLPNVGIFLETLLVE